MTPLMYAAATDHGDIEIARMLIARGADLTVKSNAGETALDWARQVRRDAAGGTAAEGGRAGHAPPRRGLFRTPLRCRPPRSASSAARRFSSARRTRSSPTAPAVRATRRTSPTSPSRPCARPASPSTTPRPASAPPAPSAAFAATATRLYERFDGPALDILLYTLAGFAAADHPADRATDALVFNIATQQQRDGRWSAGGIPRPPIEDGDFTRTAQGIRALKRYAPPGRMAEMDERARRATAWLHSAKPLSAEDRAFRLMGLTWGGADPASRATRPATSSPASAPTVDGASATRWQATPTPPA